MPDLHSTDAGSRRFRRSDDVVERRIRGEHLLVPVAGSLEQLDSIYTLNPTAGRIWELAGEGLDEGEVLNRVKMEFEVDEDAARRDITRVLDELTAIGALVPA
jgi:hypothetical protein